MSTNELAAFTAQLAKAAAAQDRYHAAFKRGVVDLSVLRTAYVQEASKAEAMFASMTRQSADATSERSPC